MPRYEGLPDGPCPGKVNDRTVRSTQGDLFLCKSCETVRIPISTPSSYASSNTQSAAGGRGKQTLPGQPQLTDDTSDGNRRGKQLPPKQTQLTCGSRPCAAKSGGKTAPGMSAKSDNAGSNSSEGTESTARHDSQPGTQAKRHAVSCSSDEIELDGNNVCVGCLNTMHEGDRYLKCNICCQKVHLDCTSVPARVHDALVEYIAIIGFVCEHCRQSMRLTLSRLQTALNTVTEEIAELNCLT